MGALKDLYKSVWEGLGGSRVFSHTSEAPFVEKLRREAVRHFISKELFNLERMLLLNPKQKGALFMSHEEDDDAPFDELELIVRNNVKVNSHVKIVKECILDLDDISTTGDAKETYDLHHDELSGKVLNMLHRQMAQVMLLNEEEEQEQAEWFVKQPRQFVSAVLTDKDRDYDLFEGITYEDDLVSADLDCHEYLRKPHPTARWNSIRTEDALFNKDALKLLRDIQNWEANSKKAKGKEREELERKKDKAKKVLAKATGARNSALRDAFRTGEISEYYYRQRTEQLEKQDYSRVPEMFEVDDLKNKEQYLKSHDLQDLGKAERDAICALALKRAIREKELYLKKEYLVKHGLSHSSRYLLSEMAINKDVFYRGLAAWNGAYNVEEEEEPEVSKISIDLDDLGEDYIGMTMRQVPSPDDKKRSLKK